MSEARKERRQFQFTTHGILVATFWAALFSSGLVAYDRLCKHELVPLESEVLAYILVGCMLFVSFPAAIGGLFGRALRGAIIGIILFMLYVGWIAFAICTWGGI